MTVCSILSIARRQRIRAAADMAASLSPIRVRFQRLSYGLPRLTPTGSGDTVNTRQRGRKILARDFSVVVSLHVDEEHVTQAKRTR